MKHPDRRLLFLSLLFFGSASAPAFEVGMPAFMGAEILDPSEYDHLEASVRDELTAAFPSIEWKLMPADLLSLVMESKGLNPSACADESCFSNLGRQLDLDILIIGYFRRTLEEDRVLLKLYDMETGKMEGFIRVTGSDPKALRNSLPEACNRLLHPYRNWKPVEAAAPAGKSTDRLTEAWTEQSEDSVRTFVGEISSGIGDENAPEPLAWPADSSRWGLGLHLATFSGASHSVLLTSINRNMAKWEGGQLISPFQDFMVGTPFGAKAFWHYKGPISFTFGYYYTQYEQSTTFYAFEWNSDRTLNSKLHEFQLGFEYILSFVKSRTIEPFVGAAVSLLYADTQLDIDLDNINNAGNEDTGEIYPSRSFLVESKDHSFGAEASVGLNYHLTRNLQLQAMIGGTMAQISQDLQYAGSLQYYSPDTHEDISDPEVNYDILWGSYPFELNGLRLNIGLLFTL